AGLGSEHRYIFLDSAQLVALDNPARGANRGVIDTSVLRHNKRYNIICSPQNMFNNWASVVPEASQFYRATAFDSSLIGRPANKCSLSVVAMKDPDSVKVSWSNPYRYYDTNTSSYIDYDSVIVYYRTDGQYPTRVGNDSVVGIRLAAFDVNMNSVSGTSRVGGVSCNQTYRFAAFPVNTVSRIIGNIYGNRTASDSIRALSGPLTPPCAPQNYLSISTSVDTGRTPAIRVNWSWNGGVSAPAFIRLLYRAAPTDTSISPPESYAASWFRLDVSNSSRATSGVIRITQSVNYRTLYVVAAFNSGADTVWAKTSMLGQLGTLYDTVRTGSPDDISAPSNMLHLSAKGLSSRSIELTWADPTNSLPGIDASENGNVSLYYGIKTSPIAPYVWKQKYNFTEFDSVRLGVGGAIKKFVLQGDNDNINANKTYYIAIAPADSVGNVNPTLLASDSVVLKVPAPDVRGVVLKPLSDTAFSVDYTSLRPLFSSADSGFVKYAVFIISDSGASPSNLFDDPIKRQDLLNGLYNVSSRTGRTFIVRQRELVTTSSDIIGPHHQINIGRTHWVSVAYMSGNELSPPVLIDTIQYSLDKPFFKTATVRQINDSIVRMTFKPYDMTDSKLGVQLKYSINGSPYFSFVSSIQFAGASFPGASASQMILDRDSAYFVDINLKARYQMNGRVANYFLNNDTTTLAIRFLVSDLYGSIPNAADDSISIIINADTKAPSSIDSSAIVKFSYSITEQKLSVTLKARAGEVAFIRYSLMDTGDLWQDSISVLANQNLSLNFEPARMIRISFRDSLGNRFDTSWHYFEKQRIHIYRGAYTFPVDNDSSMIVTSLFSSVSPVVNLSPDSAWLTVDKYIFSRSEKDSLVSHKIIPQGADAFVLTVQHDSLATKDVWQNGLTLHFKIDSTIVDSVANSMNVYKYDLRTNSVVALGAVYFEGYLTVENVKLPVHNTVASFDDSVMMFVAVDLNGINSENNNILPVVFALEQNSPNPFNPLSTIRFSVPEDQKISINIYSIDGKLVKTLFDGPISKGKHNITFNTNNLSSGRYIYRMSGTRSTITRIMTIRK
ncbi:MAG: T9SS type A sorting domain-containing protein, partial [Fibrobacteres bacterium]|nr:T9SS type A sorting domain-containing protein [Fibrobacterota bacterium]